MLSKVFSVMQNSTNQTKFFLTDLNLRHIGSTRGKHENSQKERMNTCKLKIKHKEIGFRRFYHKQRFLSIEDEKGWKTDRKQEINTPVWKNETTNRFGSKGWLFKFKVQTNSFFCAT